MQLLFLLICTLQIININAIHLQNNNSINHKVKIDIYVESLCPDCIEFVENNLQNATKINDFWKICSINIIPYGNAQTTVNGTSYVFTCQHGPQQCYGNIILACAFKLYDFKTKSLPFYICFQSNILNVTDLNVQGKGCADQEQLNWESIKTCASDSTGNQLMYEDGVLTQSLNPPHNHTPWIVVNGQYSSQSQQAIRQNLLNFVCSTYEGQHKQSVCQSFSQNA